jgi:23S rRNA pseudouridine2605 synthase
MSDDRGRKCVSELVANVGTRVYPAGRLDLESEGLLIFSNDGELVNRLTHPKHEIPKIYHVTLSVVPTREQLAALAAPMELDGYRLQPIGVKQLSPDTLKLTLFEGRNRQIRRMCEQVGLRVIRLQRVAIGTLRLGTLPPGKWRELTEDEVNYLRTPKTN